MTQKAERDKLTAYVTSMTKEEKERVYQQGDICCVGSEYLHISYNFQDPLWKSHPLPNTAVISPDLHFVYVEIYEMSILPLMSKQQ